MTTFLSQVITKNIHPLHYLHKSKQGKEENKRTNTRRQSVGLGIMENIHIGFVEGGISIYLITEPVMEARN